MTTWRMLASVFGSRILLSLIGAVLLLVMADLAEMSRQLADQDDVLSLLLSVYGALAPSLALQALPVAVLIGVLLSVTDMARSGELLALRAAGAGAMRLASPAIAISFVLAVSGLLVAQDIAPRGVEHATRVQMEKLGRMRSAWSPFHGDHSWFTADGGGLYHVAQVSEEGRRLSEVRRYHHRGGRLTAVLHAEEMVHDGDDWRLEAPLLWSLDPDEPARLSLGAEASILEDPSRFAGVGAHPEALTRRALREATELRRSQGQAALPFEIEAQSRATMPLMSLALAIVALGIGLMRPPATHVEAMAKAIGVAFAAWTLLAISRAMGLSGMVSPPVAALLPVILPAAAGLVLLLRWR